MLFSYFAIQAQIINTESLRMVTDTTGWAGKIGLSVSYSKNVKEQLKVKNTIHVHYKTNKHLILFINNIGFERIDDADFLNKGVQHLRYNYQFNPKIAWETFIQNQYNAVSKITFRGLSGIGLRYKLSKSEKYNIHIGSLLMYEYEKTSEASNAIHKGCRNSSYLSFHFRLTKNISLISTTYYQPNLSYFSDYRVAHQSVFSLKIVKNLSFRTAFNFSYDTFPVQGIPKQEFDISNGLVYRFN